jgi:CRAL/TRIO domain
MLTSLVPWVVWGFFKLITPFIDPITREKLKFNEDMKAYVPSEQLWSEDWAGDMDFEYDHDTYWPALNEMCKKRREDKKRRWEAGGKIVGESEDYLAGGTDVSVDGVTCEAVDGEGANKKLADVDVVGEKLAGTTLQDPETKVEATS